MHLNKKAKKAILISAIMAAGLSSQSASAQTLQSIYELPTNWILQNYDREDQVAIWHTSATDCGVSSGMQLYGQPERLSRFWATVMTAKLTNKKVGIYYYVITPGSCKIDSFLIEN